MAINNHICNLLCCTVFAIMFFNKIQAQQDPQYTQYMYNTMSVNPAYAGTTENLQANLLHRSQWLGIDGAPETQTLGIHTPVFKNRAGIGLNVINDKIGPSNELYMDMNFSYKVSLTDKINLSMGLKAGVHVLNINWSKGRYYDNDDQLLNNNINDRLMPNLGVGGYIYSEKWYVGLSAPNFIKTDYYDEIQQSVLADRIHYFIIGGYVFDLSTEIKFKPAFLAKVVSGAPLSVDISANFLISNLVTLGASYRWDESVSALAGFQIIDSLFIGYAYDYSVTEFNNYNNGSHELMLQFQLQDKDDRIKSPRFF